MKKTDFKEELIALRKKTGLTQADFGREFGIPKRTVESWEMGTSSPRTYNFEFLREHVEQWIHEQKR